ncbi:hypothetical protein WOLCODRAFT_17354 [Wolfiporia cocos MD-104 SS10]|uniref:Uncharacterized protein n=1 Tax=Wolfiporia cocos (strain MD-104) TaxID=742152 RepID=A0A2H3K077_WOLCO|nr:hypothetical protein WOLCODRAFT_17354 [Wolfiporia cocos MD-104 SS10]
MGASKPKPCWTKKTVSTAAAEQNVAVASGSSVGSTSIQQPILPILPTEDAPPALPTEDTLPTSSAQDVPPAQVAPPTEDTLSTPPTENALPTPAQATPAQPTPIMDPAEVSPLTTLPRSCNGSPSPLTGDKRKGHPVKASPSNPDKHCCRDKTEAQLPDVIEDEEEPQSKGKGKGKGKGLKALLPLPTEKRNTRLFGHK